MPDPTSTTACGCAGVSRSELLRGGAASAGRGLRAIEAGMPLPAGTGLSRRSFLSRTSGLALAVFGGAALGPKAFDAGIAAAEAAGEDRVLVSIFCSGGLGRCDPGVEGLRAQRGAAEDGQREPARARQERAPRQAGARGQRHAGLDRAQAAAGRGGPAPAQELGAGEARAAAGLGGGGGVGHQLVW